MHDFSDVGVKDHASTPFPRPDEPKIDQFPHIVVMRISAWHIGYHQ